MIYLIALAGLFIAGWAAAAVIGTMAYFRGEQTKPIHQRNWDNDSFEQIAQSVTGTQTNYTERVPAYALDAYTSNRF
ncbi:photosystem II protein, Psb35-related [Capilliphycus salinus ALCB114379]|uniref:photosystem II protein, Psb35-related n=1 Tax=Capilliphycus salinus TaxID=2768948 RepID=UPI0039A425FC